MDGKRAMDARQRVGIPSGRDERRVVAINADIFTSTVKRWKTVFQVHFNRGLLYLCILGPRSIKLHRGDSVGRQTTSIHFQVCGFFV
jgi:hypothetical protein